MKDINKKETRGHLDLPSSLQALYELQRDRLDYSSSPNSASANRAELGAEFGRCELVWDGAKRQASGVILNGSGWLDITRRRSNRLTNEINLCRTFRHNIFPTSVFCVGPALVLVPHPNYVIPNQAYDFMLIFFFRILTKG